MHDEVFRDLNRGDLIKHRKNIQPPDVFVVTGNYGCHITAVKTVDLTNPLEWDLVRKSFGGMKE